MHRQRVLLPQPMPGTLCQSIPGVHLRQQITGAHHPPRAMARQLLKATRVTMIANQGIESLKKKITPFPTSNISHSRKRLRHQLFPSWRTFVKPMKAQTKPGEMSSNTKRMRTKKLIMLARYVCWVMHDSR